MTNPGTIPQQAGGEPELRATVLGSLPNGMFRVRMTDGREIVAHVGRDLRMAITRLLPGDHVLVDVSPYDTNKARIVRLLKSAQASQQSSHPSQPQQRELS